MPRTVKDSSLDSRAARSRLKARSEPYWRAIDAGAHLGYYRGKRGGSWLARIYIDGRYHKDALGTADDVSDADGVGILSFSQAQKAARVFFERKRRELAGLEPARVGGYTVGAALDDYLEHYKPQGKGLGTVQSAIRIHIAPEFGPVDITRLTAGKIKKWHRDIAAAPAGLRTAARATKRNFKPAATTEHTVRQRQASSNRILTVLKAALNLAWKDGRVASDEAWRRVSPFKGAESPVIRYLQSDEITRLVNASPADLRNMVKAALLTGCRYGELCRLTVTDYDAAAGTVAVRISKSGKPRHVTLSEEGRHFFNDQTVGKASDALIFVRSDGKPWKSSDPRRPIMEACKVAKIKPAASFHVLRHTHASMLAMRGVPMGVIAAQLGHADTRMTERHYAHLSPAYVSDTIRASFPTLGLAEPSNVTAITAKTSTK